MNPRPFLSQPVKPSAQKGLGPVTAPTSPFFPPMGKRPHESTKPPLLAPCGPFLAIQPHRLTHPPQALETFQPPGAFLFSAKDLLIKVKWKFQNIEFEKKGIRNQAAEQFKIERAAGQGGIWYRFRPVSVCLDKQLPRRNKYAGTC